METTRVLITEMPGPFWWEVWLQWGSLWSSAGAAFATIAAVAVALSVARRDTAWRREAETREAAIVIEVVSFQVDEAYAALCTFTDALGLYIASTGMSMPFTLQEKDLVHARSILRLEALWRVSDRASRLPASVCKSLGKLLAKTPSFVSTTDRILQESDKVTYLPMARSLMATGSELRQICEQITKDLEPVRT